MGKTLSRQYSKTELKSVSAGITSGYWSSYSALSRNGDFGADFQFDLNELKSGLNSEDKEKILHNFRFLKGELDADILCDYFHQDGYFNIDDLEDVKSEKTRHKQMDLLLRKLVRLKPEAYSKFLEYLEDAGYKYVHHALEETAFTIALNDEDITETEADLRVTKFHDEICDQLQPDVTADIFVEYEEFSLDEYEEIIAEKTRRMKSEQILRLLKSHEPMKRGYLVLMQALRETDGLYLLRLLKEGGGALEVVSPRSRNIVNVKVCKVKKRESKNSTKLLKDGTQCRLTIKIQCDEDIEFEITKQMQSRDVMISVNDSLILHDECLIEKVEQGSIIIILRGCSTYSLRRLFAKDVQRPVTDILRHIFLHPDVMKLLPKKGLKFELTLRCMPPKQKEQRNDIDIIRSHFEFLVEELDALTFLKPLKEDHVLSDEDVKEILEATPISRKTRTKVMLQKIIDNEAIQVFKDMLKEKKQYIWEQIFYSEEDTEGFDLPKSSVATSYGMLAENMNPKLLEECYLEVASNHCWKRELQAKYMQQQVLMCDFSEQLKFINLLSLYEQLPPIILAQGHARFQNKSNPEVSQKKRNAFSRKKSEKAKVKKKTCSDIVFVGDFIIKADKETETERKHGKFASFKRSLSLRSRKKSTRDRRDRDSAYFSLPSASSTTTMNVIHAVKPGPSVHMHSQLMKGAMND